jgi:peptide deformylase
MAVLPILHWPNARLECRSADVDAITEAIRDLAACMLETMYASFGRGLAAPQLGVLQRVFVMDTEWKHAIARPLVCINPKILWRSDIAFAGPEACLSIPGIVTRITRAQAIEIEWSDLDGRVHSAYWSGMNAICAQHEIDHLDGVLTLDHLSVADRMDAQRRML